MDSDTIAIRRIERAEIPMMRDLPPPEWTIELDKIYARHFDEDYAHPIVATIGTEIVGTGMAIVNGNAVWLGTIIVRDTYRKRGIGRTITEYLIRYAQERGGETVLLMASEMGLPIYTVLGFEHEIDFLFFKAVVPVVPGSISPRITPITPEDHARIVLLDRDITGEDRRGVLLNGAAGGVVYRDAGVEGYYLPEFGRGTIIAETEKAGIELLRYRLSRDLAPVCLPETNKAGIEFLRALGLVHYSRIPRMVLHKKVIWTPEKIFSRGSGYMG